MANPLDVLSGQSPWLVAAIDKLVRRQNDIEKVQARLRQREIARELGQNRRSMNGLGRPRLEVDDYAYHYWGTRLGYKCWKDPQFKREFERDNPDARVKSRGVKEISVGYQAPALCPVEYPAKTARFVKTYPVAA